MQGHFLLCHWQQENKQAFVGTWARMMKCTLEAFKGRHPQWNLAGKSAWYLPRWAPAIPCRNNPCSSSAGCPGSAAGGCRCRGSSRQTGKCRPPGRSRKQRTWHSSFCGLGSGNNTRFWRGFSAWKTKTCMGKDWLMHVYMDMRNLNTRAAWGSNFLQSKWSGTAWTTQELARRYQSLHLGAHYYWNSEHQDIYIFRYRHIYI